MLQPQHTYRKTETKEKCEFLHNRSARPTQELQLGSNGGKS